MENHLINICTRGQEQKQGRSRIFPTAGSACPGALHSCCSGSFGGMGGGEGFWMSKTMPKHTNTAGRKGDQMKYVMILSAPKLPNSHRKLPFQDRVPKKKNETSSQLFANKDSYR